MRKKKRPRQIRWGSFMLVHEIPVLAGKLNLQGIFILFSISFLFLKVPWFCMDFKGEVSLFKEIPVLTSLLICHMLFEGLFEELLKSLLKYPGSSKMWLNCYGFRGALPLSRWIVAQAGSEDLKVPCVMPDLEQQPGYSCFWRQKAFSTKICSGQNGPAWWDLLVRSKWCYLSCCSLGLEVNYSNVNLS